MGIIVKSELRICYKFGIYIIYKLITGDQYSTSLILQFSCIFD